MNKLFTFLLVGRERDVWTLQELASWHPQESNLKTTSTEAIKRLDRSEVQLAAEATKDCQEKQEKRNLSDNTKK